MEEDEYKSTYNDLASVRCVFEKALTNNQAKCHLSQHFCLADREGYSCQNLDSSSKCNELLKKLREKSIFSLKLHSVSGPLPHNMEIRVQVGGVIGLAKLLKDEAGSDLVLPVENINGILNEVIRVFGSLDNVPFDNVIRSVVQFQGRRRRQR